MQLVFNPDEPYDLTAEEVEGLKDDIKVGMIVPWNNGDRRLRRPVAPLPSSDQSAAIEALQADNERLTRLLEASPTFCQTCGKK